MTINAINASTRDSPIEGATTAIDSADAVPAMAQAQAQAARGQGDGDRDDLLFRALGHRVRRRLLDQMKAGPQTTGMLCDAVPELDRCTVMQHLKVLEAAGLVIVERRGRERWNTLDALPIHGIHERWIGPYAAYASSLLGQLDRALRRSGP